MPTDLFEPRQLSLFDEPALHESHDLEFKAAKGGLPSSMWETYSAFANTSGGTIVLGVTEREDGTLDIHGVKNPQLLLDSLWSILNNRQKVSGSILSARDVEVVKRSGHDVIFIRVPKASRQQRPVYLNNKPFDETYRRDHSGDYRCSQEEVRRMFADQADEPVDSRILTNYGLDDVDGDSFRQFRSRMAAARRDHPWLSEDDVGLLTKLGGWRKERASGQEGLTVAGLLMFGKGHAITEPEAIPGFHLDYRERLGEDSGQRWSDRLTTDGTWEGNLFQFYQRVLPRIVATLKAPFQLDQNLYRVDESSVSTALREAVVNALIHADYTGEGGIVLDRYGDRIEMSNPGTLLLSPDQLVRGGVSECRNKSLQRMFQLMGAGDKAGSGLDKIRSSWADARYSDPRLREAYRPDRVSLTLPLFTALPEEALAALGSIFGDDKIANLEPDSVHILVMALGEERINNQMLQDTLTKHRTDLTKILGSLVADGFLRREGVGRWTQYVLNGGDSGGSSGVTSGGSSAAKSGGGSGVGSPVPANDIGVGSVLLASSLIPVRPPRIPDEQWQNVAAIALAGRAKRLARGDAENLIVSLVREAGDLTRAELGTLLDREAGKLGERFLNPMIERGASRYVLSPPNHPNQRYAIGSLSGSA